MSLINDALKQARQSQQQNPPGAQPPLRPVESASRRAADWLLPLAVIALIAGAGFFIGLSFLWHKNSAPTKPPEISAAPVVAIAPIVVPATNPPAVSNVVVAQPPSPKLQGIGYGQKSWAIVDGKTVYVGDSTGNYRVKEISQNSITLQDTNGAEKKLDIGE